LCANLADPALVGAARGRGPTAATAPGLSAGHRPPPAARDGGATPTAVPSLSAEHGPLHATRGRGPTATAKLRWTCGPDSSAGGQQQTACSWRRRSQQPQRQ
jgi:hypothetical protein